MTKAMTTWYRCWLCGREGRHSFVQLTYTTYRCASRRACFARQMHRADKVAAGQ